ncbi:MAG: cobalamin-independent methionine synthase II family protein [Acidimicrobiia bacterium]|nr:cobalamin-independent methionine synthase II family protein [Acidimicrobiia bacterium]
MAAMQIPVTHVGSLVRPEALLALLRAKRDGETVSPVAMAACLDTEVRAVVARQAAVGVDVVSDGEFGKDLSWSQYVMERMGGFEFRPRSVASAAKAIGGKDRRDFAEFYEEYEGAFGVAGIGKGAMPQGDWVVTGPITYTGHDAVSGDIARLRAALDATATAGSPVAGGFLPVVSPTSVVPARLDEHYASPEEALFAIAEALRAEYRAIVDAGLILQVDDAYLASTYDVMVPPGSLADFRRWAEVRVEAINIALDGLAEDRVRYHVCWGSWNGPHTNDVPLRDIVDLVLRVRAGGYLLEMANPRHAHEWKVFEDVALPDGKVLMPGLVSHSTNVVEHPELVAERLVRLAGLVGADRLVASTDCGFAQGPFARRVHPSIQWAKLASLAEGARLASAALG